MAATSIQQGLSVSPNSSEDVDSTHATPSTKLSAFSPAEVRESLKVNGSGIKRSKIPPAFVLAQPQSSFIQKSQARSDLLSTSGDPFVSGSKSAANTRSPTEISKLSPIASTFTPRSHLLSGTSTPSFAENGPPPGLEVSAQAWERCLPSSGRTTASLKSDDVHADQLHQDEVPTVTYPKIQKTPATGAGNGSFRFAGTHRSFSVSDGTSRSIMVSRIPTTTPPEEIQGLFNVGLVQSEARSITLANLQQALSFKSVKTVFVDELPLTGCVYVRFGDMRDANDALARIERVYPNWHTRYVATSSFIEEIERGFRDAPSVSSYEAQVLVTATNDSRSERMDTEHLGYLTLNLLRQCGDVMVLELVSVTEMVAIFRAEYCSIDAIGTALTNIRGLKYAVSFAIHLLAHKTADSPSQNLTFNIQLYQPDLDGGCQESSEDIDPGLVPDASAGLQRALRTMSVNDRSEGSIGERLTPGSNPPFLSASPGSSSFTSRKGVIGKHTPSPLRSNFDVNFSTGGSPGQSPCWNSPCAVSPGFVVQPSMLSPPFSPGTIGQERESPLLFATQHHGVSPLTRNAFRARSRQFNDHSQNFTNFVDVNRIREGIDIMLRNIPNKITQAELKSIVDETSFGKYDFMYLRIGSARFCEQLQVGHSAAIPALLGTDTVSVGYAFINFEDPIDIIEFVDARAGKRWNRFNSDKVAEVSYATIQGRDCLIAKFRNSSVMLEHHSFRPKIFFTGTGTRAGTEDAFPGPDNQSKMRRSIENAEHVGLFAPRAGQNFRDEQRRRRSHYDRGTSLAEMEESLEDHRRFQGNGPGLPRSHGLRCGASRF